jgi:hypothetical protein
VSKALDQHMNRVAELGCLICGSPAQLHHPREGQGKGQRAQDWLVMPLCPSHHTGPEGIHNRRTFYLRHRMDEWDLLALTIQRLNT